MALFPSALIHGSVFHTWESIGWRSRCLLRRVACRHEDVLDRLIHSSHLIAPSIDSLEPEISTPHFVDSFNPATSGMHLLMVERFDKILHLAPPPSHTVSLDLHADPFCHHTFSLIIESAFSSVANNLDPPLIIDSGASCCISRCRQDSSPIHPVLLKSRTYPVPTLLPVKVCCDGMF